MKYIIVAIKYFTKWIEAEPVAQIPAHCMPFWGFKALSIRQWNKIRQPTIGKVVHGARDKANFRFGRTSTNEWESRVGQQGPTNTILEEIGKGEAKLVRRNSKNFTILSHHPVIDKKKNTV